MTVVIRQQGYLVNRKRVQRLMRQLGIEAIYPKPRLSQRHPGHQVFPYLLRGLLIERANQVWCTDITYLPVLKGHFYLVAVMDWYSRKVLAWAISNTMEVSFCIEALQRALARYGSPQIFNSDQGAQFTATAFTDCLKAADIAISMDGRGRYLDNIFIERLWRSIKYELIYLMAFDDWTVGSSRWLFRLCSDKAILYPAIARFQPLIKWCFISQWTFSTIDPEEPSRWSKRMKIRKTDIQ